MNATTTTTTTIATTAPPPTENKLQFQYLEYILL
jgi:hypothetical protein